MTQTSCPVELGDVQETLLITLYLRAVESRRADAIIRDQRAIEIVDQIDYDFSKFDQAWIVQLDAAIRTEIFDERVLEFLARHPGSTIVNLGAGLDARFWRIDNGHVRWFDLDMPDSIELRQQFYSESDRNRFLAKSMLDFSWIDDIARTPDEPVLILAEGLLAYFDEAQVRSLFETIADRLPGAEFLFQTMSERYVRRRHRVQGVNRTKAVLKWGVPTGRDVARWDPRYEFLGEWAFIDRYRHRWRWLRWATWLPPVDRIVRQSMKITHLRFNPHP